MKNDISYKNAVREHGYS